jgi:molybdenum cofactor cytidylyltransferase
VPGLPVAGILLAAGTSSRMGANKLLLEIDGETHETVVRRAARLGLAGGLAPLVVVLGHEAERVGREFDGQSAGRLRVVVNADYATGIASSLRRGMAALPAGCAAVVVLLADMPRVTSAMIAELVARYRVTRAPLVVSEYQGVHAPPTLYDASLFSELRGLSDEHCARRVVRRHRAEAEVLSWPAAALADLDVPEDLERLQPGPSTDPASVAAG